MQMPGRNFHAGGSGTYIPTKSTIEPAVADLVLNSRTSNTPAIYEATNSITFIPDFTSGTSDVFEAYILETPAFSGGGT